MDSIRETGHFWLPELPDVDTAGVLTFDREDGGYIEFFSELNDTTSVEDVIETPDVIYGELSNGEKVTLFECERVDGAGGTFHRSGEPVSYSYGEYEVDTILYGLQQHDPEIYVIELDYPKLEQWFGINAFSHLTTDSPMTGGFSYQLPVGATAQMEDFTISFGQSVSESMTNFESVQLKLDSAIEFRFNDDIGIENVKKLVEKFTNLISMIMRQNVAPTKIAVTPSDSSLRGHNEILLYYLMRGKTNTPHLRSQMFRLSEIGDDIETIVQNWFDGYDTVEPLYQLYFSTMKNKELPVVNQLLNLTQAVEVYHRRTYNGNYISEEQFDEYYETLCSNIPDDFPNSYKQSLKNGTFFHANDYSLAKRLKQLRSEHSDLISNLNSDDSTIVREIVETRNYHTHYDNQTRGNNVLVGEEINKLIDYLDVLIQEIILSELGLVFEQRKEILLPD